MDLKNEIYCVEYNRETFLYRISPIEILKKEYTPGVDLIHSSDLFLTVYIETYSPVKALERAIWLFKEYDLENNNSLKKRDIAETIFVLIYYLKMTYTEAYKCVEDGLSDRLVALVYDYQINSSLNNNQVTSCTSNND